MITTLFFLPLAAFGFDARVLIDEQSHSKELSGEIQVRCLKAHKISCSGKLYSLPGGTWLLERHYGQLRLTQASTQLRYLVNGQHFEVTGSFSVDGKTIERMDLVFLKPDTHWVAHFPLDQYLYGVMGAEVPVSWPIQSLKAQAVASRTYFLFKKLQRLEQHYDVRSDIMDQVFKMDGERHKSILRAVQETKGQVLLAKEDQTIFPAYFHADCGGNTSAEGAVWRRPASLNQSVTDPYCKTASKNNWSYLIDKERLMALLQKAFFLPQGIQLKSILPRVQKASRAHIVDFLFSQDILKRISANDLRGLLGFGKLRSTHFEVTDSGNEVVFTGRGFGHGVGMCQWGAQRWARKGKDYRSILKHYYPKAELQKVDPAGLRAPAAF